MVPSILYEIYKIDCYTNINTKYKNIDINITNH